jgi:hypothetical protein
VAQSLESQGLAANFVNTSGKRLALDPPKPFMSPAAMGEIISPCKTSICRAMTIRVAAQKV